METGTEQYYERRALEYDRVYEKPERQRDIRLLGERLVQALAGRRVLEVAAGTGFWTARYADRAGAVVGTDVNDATLDVARHRRVWPAQVAFERGDAFALDDVGGSFDAAFAGFFWSHVPLDRLDRFLSGLVRRLEPASTVVVADNTFVPGSNHPITGRDPRGNTYQRRTLEDGSSWDVLKNFPTADEVRDRCSRHGRAPEVHEMTFFWLATFRTPAA